MRLFMSSIVGVLLYVLAFSGISFAAEVTVNNNSELNSAIAGANAGDRIILNHANYGDIVISNKNFTKDVILVSSDTSNPAVIEKLTLHNASNIVFDAIDFSHTKRVGEYEWSAFVRIQNSSSIVIKDSNISGSENSDVSDDTWGVFVYNSNDVTFSQNNFHDLAKGIISLQNTGFQVSENTFQKIFKSGVEIGRNSENIDVNRNTFLDFYACNISGVTGCNKTSINISVWNNGGNKKLTGVKIAKNTSLISTGTPSQFIVVNSNNQNYQIDDVEISNNLNYNNHFNGIVVVHSQNVDVINNTNIQANVSEYDLSKTINTPFIRTIGAANINIANNVTTGIAHSSSSGITTDNNIFAKNDSDGLAHSYNTLFVSPFEGRSIAKSDLNISTSGATVGHKVAVSTYSDEGYDIFLIAGQSNTHYGVGDVSSVSIPSKVFQWGRFYPNNNSVAVATVPLEHWTRKTDRAGFGVPFTSEYISDGKLKGNREVLLVPAGYGNSGFGNNFWNKGDTAYEDAISRVNQALQSKSGSVLKAILWHQGEYDAAHGASYNDYKNSLHAMIENMRLDIDGDNGDVPFVIGGMAPDWVDDNPSVYTPVENAHKDTPNEVQYSAYASPYSPTRITSMSDNIHYSLSGQIQLAERMYTAYESAQENH